MVEPPVVGSAEVAAILGVSRQRVNQLRTRADWPDGRLLKTGWVWFEADIRAWAEQRAQRLTPPT